MVRKKKEVEKEKQTTGKDNGTKPGRIFFTDDPDTAFERNITDMGNAERLITQYGSILRFNWDRSMWLVWDSKCWQWDLGKSIRELAQYTARNIYKEARDALHPEMTDALLKHAEKSENSSRLTAMITESQSLSGVSIDLKELDTDQWLLNVKNGTINLKTGGLQNYNVSDYITHMIDIDFDPEAACPLWDNFLNTITGHDADLQEYLQRMTGSCLTGETLDQVFFFLYGLGLNGKSTFVNRLLKIVGDYGMRINSEVFMVADKGRSGPKESLANLKGKRLVVTSEIEDGRQLSVGVIKDMTGGENIRADRKYEHEIEFTPTNKLLMVGNHKPTIKDTTLSIWRRLKLIPFTHTIPIEKVDPMFGNKLDEELPGILAWAVRGCLDWQEVRLLIEPKSVVRATSAYRHDQDILADFLDDCCERGTTFVEYKSGLRKAYHKWCNENEIEAVTNRTFKARIIEKGIGEKKVGRGHQWVGLRVKVVT